MSALLIQGGRLVDPANGTDAVRDLWIIDGCVSGAPVRPVAHRLLSAAGCFVFPGLVDVHVHLREPGEEQAETISTGCAAALAGGFTGVVCMPNTTPALDTPEMIARVLARAGQVGGPRVYALGAITVGRAGRELAPLREMREAGAVGFTDDGNGVQDDTIIRRALEECAALGVRLAEHCEQSDLVRGGVMHAGESARLAGLPGIAAEAESQMVRRDLRLAEALGARVHFQHISAAQSVALIRDARSDGMDVTAEVTPHHLAFTDRDAAAGGSNFKMNPPLRDEKDRRELLKAVGDGTLAIIATDHAPHTAQAKATGFLQARFGVVGLETAAAVVWTRLVLEGILTPLQMAERMSHAPAAAFGLAGGSLRLGAAGDVTVFDPGVEWVVDPKRFRSRGRNTPFAGARLTGRVVATVIGGEVRHSESLH